MKDLTPLPKLPNEAIAQKLEGYLRQGLPEATACVLADVRLADYRQWLRLSELLGCADDVPTGDEAITTLNTFASRMKKAIARVEADLLAVVLACAKAGDVKAGVWLLSRRYPLKFAQRISIGLGDDLPMAIKAILEEIEADEDTLE